MKIKKLNIILLILLSLLMIGAVSAASDTAEDIVKSDVTNNEVSHSNTDNVAKTSTNIGTDIDKKTGKSSTGADEDKLSNSNDKTIKTDANAQTYKDLDDAIQDNITKGKYTINLKSDYTYQTSDGEDLKKGITIDGTKLQGQTLTINGNGHTINGSNEARIFKVTNGAHLTLINITLTQGKGQNDGPDGDIGGGAIYAKDNCNITITDSKITHNNAEDYGGAIRASNSQINITHTNITHNNADYGGAIHAYDNSQINITHTNITHNNANYGGAIRASNSQINITNTNITHNNANNGQGGAIRADNSQINITHTNITHNNAEDYGGAIHAYDNSQINITHTNITHNNAEDYGGAIYADYNSIMVVSSSLFMDNTASKDGGAIYGRNFNNLTVNNNIFLNNTGTKEIYLYKNSNVDFNYNLDCNWFGNNATNYKNLTKEAIIGIKGDELKFDNWLFLTANGDSDSVTVFGEKNITFKLSIYDNNTGEILDYDNNPLYPVNLTLSYEKGTGDKNVRLGNNVTFKPDTVGTASVTANISNVRYTIGLTINKEVYDTKITNLSFDDLFEGKPVTVNGTLKYNDTKFLANQKINVTISNGTYIISQDGYTDGNGKFSITLTPLINGNVNITAIYDGNDSDTKITYKATNATTTANIAKITYNITFDKLQPSYDYNTTVTITGTVTTNYQTLDVTSVNITLNNGDKTSVKLNDGKFTYTFNGTIGGLNNITVTCKDATNTTQAFIKYPTTFTITVTNSTTDKPILVTVTESNKFTGTINVNINGTDYEVTLNEGIGTSNPITLTQGTYNATINYSGNETYNATTTTSDQFTIKYSTTFTIQKIPDITEGSSIDLIVNEENKYTGPVIIIVGSEKYAVNMVDGEGKVTVTPKLSPGTYNAKIDFAGNDNYTEATATSNSFKINKKPDTKLNTNIIANKKTFTLEDKNKKYTVTLKDSKGKVIKNVKVNLNVKGKKYTTKTNNKGIATFKIKLNKKGKYTATITYNGDNTHKQAVKKVKLTVKPFKKIGKGSKDKATVKKLQRALKKNGYYRYAGKRYLKIDGIYHKWTFNAVKQYQKAKGLKATGTVNYQTAKKLKII